MRLDSNVVPVYIQYKLLQNHSNISDIEYLE